jgi:aspartate/tyrosine/aromatic aminotransferase
MPNLLSPEVKTKTLELLRSGTIEQTIGVLKNRAGCRCVLGVIALAGNVPHDEDMTMDAEGKYFDLAYQGFEAVGLDEDACRELITLNDRKRLTFPELAYHIEANL